MSDGAIVYLLDDEPEMLKALSRVLNAHGIETKAFLSAREFLAHDQTSRPACLVLDLAMPELDGLEVQRRLSRDGVRLPIVFLTGHGDIPTSVRAMKAGAEDFLTKPVDAANLLRAVCAAIRQAEEQQAEDIETDQLRKRLDKLTPRQREVLEYVIAGKMNKNIAAELGTGEQNIKVHRRRLIRKMGVKSLAELVRLAERLGVEPAF
jgi:RNA polymerase sigma factor (sigma-70 family)